MGVILSLSNQYWPYFMMMFYDYYLGVYFRGYSFGGFLKLGNLGCTMIHPQDVSTTGHSFVYLIVSIEILYVP